MKIFIGSSEAHAIECQYQVLKYTDDDLQYQIQQYHIGDI